MKKKKREHNWYSFGHRKSKCCNCGQEIFYSSDGSDTDADSECDPVNNRGPSYDLNQPFFGTPYKWLK